MSFAAELLALLLVPATVPAQVSAAPVVPTPISSAPSDRSLWSRAKEPGRPVGKPFKSTDEIHRTVATWYRDASVGPNIRDPMGGVLSYSRLRGARDLLEAHGAATSDDPRLRYDLGFVLAKMEDWKGAAFALDAATRFAPHHPFSEDGFFELGVSHAHLGRHVEEERAYLEALSRTDRRFGRSILLSNLAESRMAQGRLRDALDAVEESLVYDADNPAAHWNHAILLDRVGDGLGAIVAADRAIASDPDLLYIRAVEGSGTFFEPDYEREWYLALASLAAAEGVVGEYRDLPLLAALAHYQAWLDAAPADARYRPRALDAVATLEVRLGLAKKKGARKK
jgi:tetratricopeptide (TPR) repeat protein